MNIEYFVGDAELAVEDLPSGLQVLRHLRVDTKTLLEGLRDSVDGSDSTKAMAVSISNNTGRLGRLMNARLN